MAVGFVRAAAGVATGPRLTQLIGELSLSDPDFRTWWADRHVQYPRRVQKPVRASAGAGWVVSRLLGVGAGGWRVVVVRVRGGAESAWARRAGGVLASVEGVGDPCAPPRACGAAA
ncbi:MAG: hypothetical protein ACREIV_07325 [Planctomycetaceae bacterium]